MADRLTGKASSFTYGGTLINITKYTWNVDRALANATDNGDYAQITDIISPTQIPYMATTKVDVEGRFRKSQTPAAIVTNLYSGVSAVPVTLGLDAGSQAGHGAFDIGNFSCEVPIDDIVTFKCSMTSNGPFTPNS